MTAHVLVSVFIVAVVVVPLCMAVVPCDCGYGTVVSSEPCQCQCSDPYILPSCAFTASDTVKVRVVVNETRTHFSSTYIESEIKSGLGLPSVSASVYYRGLESNTSTTVTSQWGIEGRYVPVLVSDVAASKPYVLEARIVSAERIVPQASAKNDLFDNAVIYEGGKFTITLNTVGWLLGAIVLVLLLCISEWICITSINKYAPDLDDVGAQQEMEVVVQPNELTPEPRPECSPMPETSPPERALEPQPSVTVKPV